MVKVNLAAYIASLSSSEVGYTKYCTEKLVNLINKMFTVINLCSNTWQMSVRG